MKQKNVLQKLILITCLVMAPILSTAQNVGQSAPDFTVNTLGGSSFTLSDNLGKVVFIFLFGYACPHCLGNGNNTETGIYSMFKDNENFVAIGIDTWDGNKSGVQSFQNSTGITYPLGLDGSSVQSAYSTTYDRIIVIDQDGIIRYKATANATTSVVNQAKEVIDEYIGLISGIEDELDYQNSFSLYPVPAQDELRIKSNSPASDIHRLSIYGLQGKLLLQKDDFPAEQEGEISLPVVDLKNGVYLLRIETDGNSIISKFSVAK